MTAPDVHRTIEAVWRIESARLIAALTRIVRDVGEAEELAQDALVAAMEQWPNEGVPENPAAWLMGTAKHRALDLIRRRAMLDRKHSEIGREIDQRQENAVAQIEESLDDYVGDDLLRLIFIACHPVLSTEARVALTLRLIGGLTTDEIARAFLAAEPTIAQRIVRAKRALSEAGVPFELPRGADLEARVSSVLEVIYLIFNEGYSATAGDDWMRPALCEEAMRLARILAGLLPHEPEVLGLLALTELQASRIGARTTMGGDAIPLAEQDRGRWDHVLIQRGLAALARAGTLSPHRGPYTLQAAIAACHARAGTSDATDWKRIVALYDELLEHTPSPVVALNRAVALSRAFGAVEGLEAIDALASNRSLRGYHLLPAARGDLLMTLDRMEEARVEFERAASLTRNARERALLLQRAASCAKQN